MRKTIIISCLVLSGFIILDSLKIGDSIAMFLFVGALPGTSHSLSASQMLVLTSMLLGFVLSRLANSLAIKLGIVEQLKRFEQLEPIARFRHHHRQAALHSQPKAAAPAK